MALTATCFGANLVTFGANLVTSRHVTSYREGQMHWKAIISSAVVMASTAAALMLPTADASSLTHPDSPNKARLISVQQLPGGDVGRTWTSGGETYKVAGPADTRLLSFHQTRTSQGGSASASFGPGDEAQYVGPGAKRPHGEIGGGFAAQYADAISVGFTPAQARAMQHEFHPASQANNIRSRDDRSPPQGHVSVYVR